MASSSPKPLSPVPFSYSPVPVSGSETPIPVPVPVSGSETPISVPVPVPDLFHVPFSGSETPIPVPVPDPVPVPVLVSGSETPIPGPVPDPVPVPAPVPGHSFPPPHVTYKNRLQEFALRSKISLPMYQTVDVGGIHAPMFKSTVRIGERSYTTQSSYFQRKAAEQEVAKIALESLLELSRDEGLNLVSKVSPFCKSILNEYANKLHVQNPTYNTVLQQGGGVIPIFTSTLVFNGKSYTGHASRTKKDAENSAAHAAILSIMGDSSLGTTLIEMIKSKPNFFYAIEGNISQVQTSAVSATTNAGNTSVTLDQKDTVVASSMVDNNNNNETKVEFPESSDACKKFQTPNQEPSPEATKVSLELDLAHSDSSSSKKRKKNKKKANKKSRLESLLPVDAVPTNQVPTCSVSQ